MKKILVLFLCFCTLAITSGCGVSESDYQEALSERDSLKSKLSALEGKLANSDKELSFAGGQRTELQKEVKKLSEEVRQLKDERRNLLARLNKGNNKGDSQPFEPTSGGGGPGDVSSTDDAPATDDGAEYYEVKPNDTLWRISRKHKVPLKTLIELNDIGPNFNIKVGQKIRIK